MLFLHPKWFLFLTENLDKVTETFTNRERMVFADTFTSGEQSSSLEFTVGQDSLLGLERRGNKITMTPLSQTTKWFAPLPSHLSTFGIWVSHISAVHPLPFCGKWLEFCEYFLLHTGCSCNMDKVNLCHSNSSLQISTDEISQTFQ